SQRCPRRAARRRASVGKAVASTSVPPPAVAVPVTPKLTFSGCHSWRQAGAPPEQRLRVQRRPEVGLRLFAHGQALAEQRFGLGKGLGLEQRAPLVHEILMIALQEMRSLRKLPWRAWSPLPTPDPSLIASSSLVTYACSARADIVKPCKRGTCHGR